MLEHCYLLSIFCELSVYFHSCFFCMLFSVHRVTSTTVFRQMTKETVCRSTNVTKDICKCMPLTVNTTHTTLNIVSILAMGEKILAGDPQAENTTINIQTLGPVFKNTVMMQYIMKCKSAQTKATDLPSI
jgi:hypothetical protein